MAAKEPRIHAVMFRVRCLVSADCPCAVFFTMPARPDLTRLAISDLSWRSASAIPANPMVHGKSRARNHHSRASHKLQAKNMTTSSEKTSDDKEITVCFSVEVTGSFSVSFAFCLFLFLRHA